jgi:UDP-galactopyranose mutase
MTNLISENYIKTNSPVTDMVQAKDLYPHIQTAQFNFLRVTLGSDFYDHILDAFENQTLTPDEITLVQDYIQPSLLYRTLALALPFMQYNLRAKGLMVNSDDSAAAAGINELKFIINETKNRAEVLEEYLRSYLCKYANLYPLYKTQNGLTPPDNSTNFDSGLVFY